MAFSHANCDHKKLQLPYGVFWWVFCVCCVFFNFIIIKEVWISRLFLRSVLDRMYLLSEAFPPTCSFMLKFLAGQKLMSEIFVAKWTEFFSWFGDGNTRNKMMKLHDMEGLSMYSIVWSLIITFQCKFYWLSTNLGRFCFYWKSVKLIVLRSCYSNLLST